MTKVGVANENNSSKSVSCTATGPPMTERTVPNCLLETTAQNVLQL